MTAHNVFLPQVGGTSVIIDASKVVMVVDSPDGSGTIVESKPTSQVLIDMPTEKVAAQIPHLNFVGGNGPGKKIHLNLNLVERFEELPGLVRVHIRPTLKIDLPGVDGEMLMQALSALKKQS